MKQSLKPHIKAAHREALLADNFLQAFELTLIDLITNQTEYSYFRIRNLSKDIQYISTMSKVNGFSAGEYLRLIHMYVVNKVNAYHQQQPKRREVSLEMHYAA